MNEKPSQHNESYRTKSHPVGRVYVINNQKFQKKTLQERKGAEYDSINIQSTFVKLGYEVILHKNLSKVQTDRVLDSIRDDMSLKEIDSIIIFILTHGLGEDRPFIYFSSDGQEMSLTDLRQRFSDFNCPQMKGKPKIIFSNFCRGPKLETDGNATNPHDMVTIYSGSERYMAPRDPSVGTIFVISLCEVLQDMKSEMELTEFYNNLEQRMSSYDATTPVLEYFAFRKRFFFQRKTLMILPKRNL